MIADRNVIHSLVLKEEGGEWEYAAYHHSTGSGQEGGSVEGGVLYQSLLQEGTSPGSIEESTIASRIFVGQQAW